MKATILKLLHRFGYDIVRYPDPESPKIRVFELVLEHVVSVTPDFFFVQIGANNGVRNDPIHKHVLSHHWRGILVEPQPDVFRELVANYAGETQLIFENVAIAAEDGVVSIFTEDDSVPGQRRTGQASLFKEHVAFNLGKGGRIKELRVPALSVSSLISKHAISKVDLLQIDAERYDFEIIKMFGLSKLKPTIINFEHQSLYGPERRACWKYLADRGYSLRTDPTNSDTVAYLEADQT
jgi:FkbM family methyltransferase